MAAGQFCNVPSSKLLRLIMHASLDHAAFMHGQLMATLACQLAARCRLPRPTMPSVAGPWVVERAASLAPAVKFASFQSASLGLYRDSARRVHMRLGSLRPVGSSSKAQRQPPVTLRIWRRKRTRAAA